MQIKLILYFAVSLLTLWSVSSLNIDRFFRKGHVNQIKVFYLLITFALSYLITNFLYDFYLVSKY